MEPVNVYGDYKKGKREGWGESRSRVEPKKKKDGEAEENVGDVRSATVARC